MNRNTPLKLFIVVILGCMCTTASYGQLNFFAYKKHKHTWENESPVSTPVNQDYKDYDAYYVSDHRMISIGGSLGSITNILFQRHARIKYNTQKGIDKKNKITIPESLDPAFDDHSWPFTINKVSKGPSYFDLALEQFAVRIIKQDGRVMNAEMDDLYHDEESIYPVWKYSYTLKYVKNHYWDFVIKNIEPGDELELYYEYMIPFDENFIYLNSTRVFHHSDLPKQDYSLLFRYRTGPTHQTTFVNDGDPDSTSVVDKVKNFYWTKQNLHATLNETGSRPYESLPYFILTTDLQSNAYQYNDPVTSEMKYAPYWVYILRLREHFDYTMRRNAENNLKDKQNLLVRDFINSVTSGIADSLNYQKFVMVHNAIADDFKYYNDEKMFREEDNRAERLGDFTKEGTIREISRQKLYAKILNNLKVNYFTLYLTDKRYATINFDYLSPIWNTECVYAAVYNNNLAFAHPKKSDYGWYMEELPFYWENTTGLLINNDDLFYELVEKPNLVRTAASSLNDNTRVCNVMVNVDLNDQTALFESKVSLAGQYSTMTRSLYTKQIADSLCNPYYRKHIYDINSSVTLISSETTKSNNTFPYNFEVKNKYKSEKVVSKNNDGSYSLDLSGWFNHIIDEVSGDRKRYLDYYPDFAGQDTYRYLVKFNTPVNVIDLPENREIKNALGNLTIKFSQPGPDVLLIESQFIVIADKVTPAKFTDVIDTYKTINELNHTRLSLNK